MNGCPICIKYRYSVSIASLPQHIIAETSIGAENGGESGKFYAADGNVNFEMTVDSIEYFCPRNVTGNT